VNLFLDCRIFIYFKLCIFRLAYDQFSAQKVLQTVVAGRQAENLLQVFSFSGHRKTLMTSYIFRHKDFDDNTLMEGQPPGLAATQVFSQTPAAVSLLAGTSSNPLDDLVYSEEVVEGGADVSHDTSWSWCFWRDRSRCGIWWDAFVACAAYTEPCSASKTEFTAVSMSGSTG
jgi:hypothetical protein